MIETGVPNLDLILGGGIPDGDLLLVTGQAGTGKTTLALQVGFHTASQGRNVLYVSTVSEPVTRLIRHIRSFAFYDESAIGKSLLIFSAYPLIEQGLDAVVRALSEAVKEHRAALLVIDDLAALRDVRPDAAAFRAFVYDLGSTLATRDSTVVMTTSAVPSAAG